MTSFLRISTGGLAITAVLATFAQPARAADARAEQIAGVRLVTLPACPIGDDSTIEDEIKSTREFLGPILAGLFATLAGKLVETGLNAAGDALEQASKEKAIGVEATSTATVSRIELSSNQRKPAVLKAKPLCLVLYSPEGSGSFSDIVTNKALEKRLFVTDQVYRSEQIAILDQNGITNLPNFYAEVRVLQGEEGIILRPMTVLYRTAFKGAPPKKAASELHVSLATPALPADATAIGTNFALSRIQLPKIAPGQLLGVEDLKYSSSLTLPSRPITGFPADRLAAINAVYTALATRKGELKVAQRAKESAERKLKAKPNDEGLREALVAATELLGDADAALVIAQAGVDDLEKSNAQVINGIGATNIKMRFVVIREPNAFGLALAKALQGAAKSTGEAVSQGLTSELKPNPEWAAADTAYLTALTTLQAKERAYAEAVEKGEAGPIAAASAEVLLAKAKVNEAAVALNRPIPYPQLF